MTNTFTNQLNTASETASFEWNMNDAFDGMFDGSLESVSCLARVAANTSLPASMLEEFAFHAAVRVRVALATNASAPADALKILGGDDSLEVRIALATNKCAPIEVLQMLVGDDSSYVSVRAIGTLDRIGRGAGVLPLQRTAFERKLFA